VAVSYGGYCLLRLPGAPPRGRRPPFCDYGLLAPGTPPDQYDKSRSAFVNCVRVAAWAARRNRAIVRRPSSPPRQSSAIVGSWTHTSTSRPSSTRTSSSWENSPRKRSSCHANMISRVRPNIAGSLPRAMSKWLSDAARRNASVERLSAERRLNSGYAPG